MQRISARTIAYIGVIAADIAILTNAVLIWDLLGSGSSFASVGTGSLFAALHGAWLFSSLRQRLRGPPRSGVKPFALAVLIAASILPVSGIPSGWAGALLVQGGMAQAAVIIMAAFTLVVSFVVGAVLGVWFFVVAGNVMAAETTLARDGAQLVTLSVCTGWALIG